MQLHTLKFNKTRKRQRIGRGGKRGSFSGRGVKGQKSRAGRKMRPAERDLILKLPKLRGFRNKEKAPQPKIVNLEVIVGKMKPMFEGKKAFIVNRSTLKQFGFIPMHYQGEVKILAGGDIAHAITVQGLKVSENAKMKIEKAGGKVS